MPRDTGRKMLDRQGHGFSFTCGDFEGFNLPEKTLAIFLAFQYNITITIKKRGVNIGGGGSQGERI
jgi:hypothetical protein